MSGGLTRAPFIGRSPQYARRFPPGAKPGFGPDVQAPRTRCLGISQTG